MPPTLLFDLSKLTLDCKPIFSTDDILKLNPQNYEMQQLDGILWYDKDKKFILGYKDVNDDEFWVRGHIPGRPIMPGVIMVECAAQLLSFYVKSVFGVTGFVGFTGIDNTKFRSTVVPGNRLYLLGYLTKCSRRRYSARVQGVVNGTVIFETDVSGMHV